MAFKKGKTKSDKEHIEQEHEAKEWMGEEKRDDSVTVTDLLPESGDVPEHFTSSVKQLYCRTGYNLAIDADGKVYGTPEPFSQNAILQLSSDQVGEVHIRAEEAGMYVAMDDEGFLYGQKERGRDETVFYEQLDGKGWNSYMSKKHSSRGWMLAIKKSGRPKKGPQTARGQRATQFLPRPAHPPSSFDSFPSH